MVGVHGGKHECGSVGRRWGAAVRWIPWEDLLYRVFGRDVVSCPACGARIWLVDQVTDPVNAQRELMRMGQVVNVIALLGVAIDRPVAHQRTSLPYEACRFLNPSDWNCSTTGLEG
jgi:hypothetical protein